jgi:hypothetical protein
MNHAAIRSFLPLVLFAVASLPSGCTSGTETGNPPFQAELSYAAYSSQPLQVSVREAGTPAVVDNAWLDLASVALVTAGTCGSAAPLTSQIPALGIGDHAAGKHNVTLFQLAAGTYCSLDLPFMLADSRALDGDAPAELVAHSLLIEGSLADGSTFSISSDATPTVHLVADSGRFEITKDQSNTLIAFDVATWLSGLDWASATRTLGAVQISATENVALLTQFEANLAKGIALYRDADGDGKLDVNPVRLAHAE